MQDTLPKFCLKSRCLKRSNIDQNFAKARQGLQKEMDLIKILQQLRFFNAAIDLLLTRERAESLRNSTLMHELEAATKHNVSDSTTTEK